jgi:hypothetical protein
MGEDFSESVGEDISEQAGAIISESVGGFPRNQQRCSMPSRFSSASCAFSVAMAASRFIDLIPRVVRFSEYQSKAQQSFEVLGEYLQFGYLFDRPRPEMRARGC